MLIIIPRNQVSGCLGTSDGYIKNSKTSFLDVSAKSSFRVFFSKIFKKNIYRGVNNTTTDHSSQNPDQHFSFEMINIINPRVILPAGGACVFKSFGAFMRILNAKTRRRRRFLGSLGPRSRIIYVNGGGSVARRRREILGIRVMIWDHSGGGGSATGGGPFGEGDRVWGSVPNPGGCTDCHSFYVNCYDLCQLPWFMSIDMLYVN